MHVDAQINKNAFLESLGLVSLSDSQRCDSQQAKKSDQQLQLVSHLLNNKKKRNNRCRSRLIFTIPITIVARNSYLFERFYKCFNIPVEFDYLTYEKYCLTGQILEKNDLAKKSRASYVDPINCNENAICKYLNLVTVYNYILNVHNHFI